MIGSKNMVVPIPGIIISNRKCAPGLVADAGSIVGIDANGFWTTIAADVVGDFYGVLIKDLNLGPTEQVYIDVALSGVVNVPTNSAMSSDISAGAFVKVVTDGTKLAVDLFDTTTPDPGHELWGAALSDVAVADAGGYISVLVRW